MEITFIISLIALITSLTSAILIIVFNSRIKNKKSREPDSVEKSDDSKQDDDERSLEQLAKDVFSKARAFYDLKANSYTNIVNAIEEEQSISSSDKKKMIYFFKEIISITYKDKELKQSKKEKLFESGLKIETELDKRNNQKKPKKR